MNKHEARIEEIKAIINDIDCQLALPDKRNKNGERLSKEEYEQWRHRAIGMKRHLSKELAALSSAQSQPVSHTAKASRAAELLDGIVQAQNSIDDAVEQLRAIMGIE